MNEMEQVKEAVLAGESEKIRSAANAMAAYAIKSETGDTLDCAIEVVRWTCHLANSKEK